MIDKIKSMWMNHKMCMIAVAVLIAVVIIK